MNDRVIPQCAICSVKERACRKQDGTGPDFCPTLVNKKTIERVNEEYEKPEIKQFAKMASLQEAECYGDRHITPYVLHTIKPRVQEICEQTYNQVLLAVDSCCLNLYNNEITVFIYNQTR